MSKRKPKKKPEPLKKYVIVEIIRSYAKHIVKGRTKEAALRMVARGYNELAPIDEGTVAPYYIIKELK